MTAVLPQPASADEPRRFPGIVLDGMLFTLVEPEHDRAVEYNRWYEGDHFYATVVGPGVVSGRRFVCTSELKGLRLLGSDPVVPAADIGSFLAMYFLVDTDGFSEWGATNTGLLHDAGRIFTAREHIHTLMYLAEWAWAPTPDSVSPEIALDHPFELLVTEFWRPTEAPATFSERLRAALVPRLERSTSPDLVLAFRPRPLLADAPGDVARAADIEGALLVTHFYRSASAADVMAAVRASSTDIEATTDARLRFASPFIPTVPGTDLYTDDLWDVG